MIKTVNTIMLFLLLLGLAGCVSAPDGAGREEPSWIKRAPADQDYYVGISGADSGSESDDKERAYDRALQNLAGAISTGISASTTLSEKEDREGYEFLYENNIAASVSQNLENIEVVDSYYSEELGYWFYLRLSHDDWDRLVDERAEEYRELARDLFYDTFRDSLSELHVINRAMKAYEEAYSGRPIKMELFGQKGSADTLLTLRAEELLGEMTLGWSPLPAQFMQSSSQNIKGRVALNSEASYNNPGTLDMALTDEKGEEIARFRTEQDGAFDVSFSDDSQGNRSYTLSMATPFQGVLAEQTAYKLPEGLQQVLVTPLLIPFELESEWANRDLSSRTTDFLTRAAPWDLTPRTGSEKSYLKGVFSFREAPKNDFGMIITYATLFLHYVTPAGEELIWKSPEVKDGGLSADQANQRASEKLFDQLGEDRELREALSQLP